MAYFNNFDDRNGDQFKPEFLAVSPNNKIPALVDPDGPDGKPIALFESGAILIHLAAKTGKFLPATDRLKYQVLQWLMFQMAVSVPCWARRITFACTRQKKVEYAVNRYSNEAKRLYGVMDQQLAHSQFIACDDYTIADIAIFPWLRSWENQGIDWADYPHLKKWFDAIAARPTVQRGVKLLADLRVPITGDKAREILFGRTQYQKR